ncbi:MAG: chromosome segregation protein SMC [Acidobacteria bacterium]|nr:chromosome segregation protein SMC [Acidobacteriota bacterium]
MLKLDRLELSGFKSFVDPVELRFAGGITGIVGPNGCGKSNLADAITWVLGEQSAKTMRGDTMEDVIFGGSEKRRPLGMGEVSLTFLADPGFAGSDDGRVTISRRVFRSGESQYRINGKLVRLKEIKDLLMDTGLGIRAYSVIEQGKIGLILSGKPQERRKLIEEAAGITRYKARKRIAEVKLEEASANLMRLDDILSEVDRNLRSLKRQAGAARRWQERKAELEVLQRTVLLGRWSKLAAETTARRITLGDAQAREAEQAAAVTAAEAALAQAREGAERLAEDLSERSRRQAELGATIEGRQQMLAGARRTIAEIDSRTASGTALADRRREESTQRETTLEELATRRSELVAEHDRSAAEVDADGAKLREVEAAAAEAEAGLERARQALLASLGELDALRSRIHREQIENEKGSYRQRHLFEELALRGEELGEAAAALEATERRLEELAAEISERDADLAGARARLEELLAREGRASEELRSLETERTARGERLRFLADLEEDDAQAAEELLSRLREAGLDAPRRLREAVRALRGWETSLDLFLGDLLDAIVLPEGIAARELAVRLATGGRSVATLLRPLAEERPAAWPRPHDAAIVASLGEALDLPAPLAHALPPAYLVSDSAAAERLAATWPGVAFLTRDRFWLQGGLLHLEGSDASPGLLARSTEREELSAEIERLETRLAGTRTEIETLVGERSGAAEAIHRLQERVTALRQEQAATRARREETAQRHRRLATSEEALRREQGELASELSRLATRHEDSGSELARLETTHAEREATFDRLRGEVEEVRRERESVRALGAGRRGQLEVLVERLRSLDQQTDRLNRELAASRNQDDAWQEESTQLAARRLELEEGMAIAERELQEALELRVGGEEALRAAQERLESARQEVRRRDGEVAGLRTERDALRNRVEEERVELAGLEHDARHLTAELEERCALAPPEVPGEPPENLVELETDLQRLRQQIESMGPVNVLAAEEFGAEEERHTFLTAQRADVAKSVDSLRQTIREINETSSARFREAFAQVNEQFSRTFVDLFRGGEAEMRLMDEEDPLESGIEIVARPPGKRMQNLMLMSGGEKALTAIALLFALFRIKPSPFCILDEVDAPLDDVNTLRFVGMLRQLAQETQCIVITHNKLTMQVCGTLYGVTMEERGVSKLVSVALEEVQPEAATA